MGPRFLLNLFRTKKRELLAIVFVFAIVYYYFSIKIYEDDLTDVGHHNFVYIKMMKCASETLSSMFSRYGLIRGLSFVLPIAQKIYLGWPHKFNSSFYRMKKTENFNILTDHCRYNRKTMDEAMPKNTKYLTSLRQPFDQFKSTFHYYKIGEILGQSFETYMTDIKKWDALYMTPAYSPHRFCVPDGLSMTRNPMAFTLGFPLGWPPGTPDKSDDPLFIEAFLRDLERDFDLVIIVEYFDESLIVLKHMMNWRFKDILYFPRNVGQYDYKKDVDQAHRNLHRAWSPIDYKLYDTFNRTLWERIQLTPRMREEVGHFRAVLGQFRKFCDDADKPYLELPASRFGPREKLDLGYCRLVAARLLKDLKMVYETFPGDETAVPEITYC